MKKITISLSLLLFFSSFSYGKDKFRIGVREFDTMSDVRKYVKAVKKKIDESFPKQDLKVELEKINRRTFVINRETTLAEAGVRGNMMRIIPPRNEDRYGRKKCDK